MITILTDDMLKIALAHEIKTPAAVAMAYVGLIRHESDSPLVAEYCNHIQQALTDISELVQEILFAAEAPLPPYDIDIAALLSEMLSEYSAMLPDITFFLNVKPPLMCHTREQYVRLIFSNLLKNAVEATGEGGNIIVYATTVYGYLHTVLHNSGSVKKSSNRHSNGIGLSICNWLVQQLCGEFHVQKSGDNGCVVTVSLPCYSHST